jgi:hypothetical protein
MSTATWLVGMRLKLSPRARLALHSVLVTAYAQAVLGILTLVSPILLRLDKLKLSAELQTDLAGFASPEQLAGSYFGSHLADERNSSNAKMTTFI